MADDLLPLLGVNLLNDGGNDEDSSGSDEDHEDHGFIIEDIHIEVDEEEEDQNNNGESRSVRRQESITYDTSLPGTHSYLGSDLEDVTGRTIYDEDGLVTMPLIKVPGMVLVPGETIPLTLFHQHVVAMIKGVKDSDKTFGVVAYRFNANGEIDTSSTANIGTTAEIFSYKDETDDQTGLSSATLMAKGRQRFKVIESRRSNTGILMGKIKILMERILPDFLEGARPPSHCKFCCNPTEQDSVVQTAVDRQGNVIANVSMLNNRQINRFTSAYYTWWPPWVYKMYDPELVVQRMKQKLCKWNETLQAETLTNDPVELSFWVCKNLPLDDNQRLNLLSIDNAIQRLRCSLSIMEKCSVICCRQCKTQIAFASDVFCLSAEGPLGAYVNPDGHVHETLTVYKSQNINLMGRPTKEHSWFPGYAWTIAYCRVCTNHMGWKFTASKKDLIPQKFFGLTRASVAPGMQHTEELPEGETWMPTM